MSNFENPAPSSAVHSPWVLSRLSWGSVFAGCFVALGIHFLLAMLGIGMGIRLVNPATDLHPMATFSAAAGIAWVIGSFISLWVGGWVAGRTAGHGYGNVGGLHGCVVWSVFTVASLCFFAGRAGLAVQMGLMEAGHAAGREAASWAFLAFAVGAFAAGWGGRHGALRAFNFHRLS